MRRARETILPDEDAVKVCKSISSNSTNREIKHMFMSKNGTMFSFNIRNKKKNHRR